MTNIMSVSISISIFSELPYRYRFRYRYFPELPYRYRYRYRYFQKWPYRYRYRYRYLSKVSIYRQSIFDIDISNRARGGPQLIKQIIYIPKMWEAKIHHYQIYQDVTLWQLCSWCCASKMCKHSVHLYHMITVGK